jgi:hypothetical protein
MFFPCVIPPFLAAFRRADRLAVDDRCRGRRLHSGGPAYLGPQRVMALFPRAIVSLTTEDSVNRAPVRDIGWQHPPLAPG